MPNALLDRLRGDFNGLRDQVEGIQTAAANEGRDLTEAEDSNVADLLQRAEVLRPRIESLVAQEASFGATADALSRVTQGGTGEQIVRSGEHVNNQRAVEIVRSMYPTPGHYMLDMLLTSQNQVARSQIDGLGMASRVPEAQARLARATEIMRAAANVTTAETPGLLPTPIVGDVINVIDASRPVFASMTSRPMPGSGKTFNRPVITQHTQVAKQATEKTEIASRALTVTGMPLTKDTYGGYVDISVQDVDWTDPAVLSIVLSDLGDQYAIQTEAAVSAVLAAITQTQTLPATPTAEEVTAFIAGAAAKVYAGGKALPNRAWVSVDMWATLVALTATDGRPAFPGIGASNAAGTMGDVSQFVGNILGLPLVVGPALPAGSFILGASKYSETYEDVRGSVRQFEVALLGWLIGYYGYMTAAVTVPAAFCKAAAA